jgi:RNA polymerase-binding transcription factor DksA
VEALALKRAPVTHIVPLTGRLDGRVKVQSFEVNDREFSSFENISKALIRLDQGIYGRCTCCGGRIETDVLVVAPLANRCIACAHQESHP